MFWYGHGMDGWGWALMMFGTLLFWGLVIALVVVLVRSVPGRGRAEGPTGPTPQQVLADRFARGEIDEEEYRARLRVLAG